MKNLVELLRYRAERQGNETLYTFLKDGEFPEISVTWEQLDRQARGMAALLQSLSLRGERVILLYPPGLDYIAAFFACLYAAAIAVPAYPPEPVRLSRAISRLESIVDNCKARGVLTTQGIWSALKTSGMPSRLTWLTTENAGEGDRWSPPDLPPDTPAFIQYTSGSTGVPKGVVLSHENLLYNLSLIARHLNRTAESRGVSWLPFYHDMGLIDGLLSPVYGGYPTVLMAPSAFLERPVRWLKAISHYRATTSGGPNFSYDLCVRKTSPQELREMDLSCWQDAYNGAEPVRRETIDRFCQKFAACGFRREAMHPCYGLAEATLVVSAASSPTFLPVKKREMEEQQVVKIDPKDTEPMILVSCGKICGDQKVVIAAPESLKECPPYRIGEIWVSGPGVARGYWNRPEDTSLTFHAHLADKEVVKFLRTGDLGFLHDGELYITGRLKDLIIIRGRNYYPQDIEEAVEKAHSGLRPGCGAAFSVDIEGEEKLVIAYEVDTEAIYSIFHSIRRAVLENYGISVSTILLLKPRTIPKTTSGKIQRTACRLQFLKKELKAVAIWEENQGGMSSPERASQILKELEQWLLAKISAKQGKIEISPDRPFSDYLSDSIELAELKDAIEDDFGIALSIEDFFQEITISEIAAKILCQMDEEFHATWLL